MPPRCASCQQSKAQYLQDDLHVLLMGEHARVLGMRNHEYNASLTASVVPFETNDRWFPVAPLPENHVILVANEDEYQQRLLTDRPPDHHRVVDGRGGHPMDTRISYKAKRKFEVV
jgi:hypothetical protein